MPVQSIIKKSASHLKKLLFIIKHDGLKALFRSFYYNITGRGLWKKWLEIRTRRNKERKICFIPYAGNRPDVAIEISGTCNLSCKMCSVSIKPEKQKAIMDFALFKKIFDGAVKAGWKNIKSCSAGEIFCDKKIWEKLDYIENSPAQLNTFRINTNFCMLKPNEIAKIFGYKKLTRLKISIYGFDRDSFSNITRKKPEQFDRLVKNLKQLREINKRQTRPFRLEFNWWIGNMDKFNKSTGEFKKFVLDFGKEIDRIKINPSIAVEREGVVESDLVEETGIRFDSKISNIRVGPCNRLYVDFIVHSDGSVAACACHSKIGNLYLGNINDSPLDYLLSTRNENFRKLIDEQERGHYRAPCDRCSKYWSIYAPKRNSKKFNFDDLGVDMAKLDLCR